MKKKIQIVLYLLCSSMVWSPSYSQSCNKADSLELVKFYHSTGGLNWAESWNLQRPVKTWSGVRLSPAGNVISLILQTNNLKGTLPDIKLPEMVTLKLGFNQLNGTLPNFSNLGKLETLYLSSNKLSGVMPSFDKLRNIVEIDLSVNQLSGQVPEIKSQTIKVINLASNAFTGDSPKMSYTASLKKLVISDNRLSGSIPDFFGLYQLEELNLSGNRFTGKVPNFSGSPYLRILKLSNNKLTGNIPDFNKLAKLQFLALDHNQLSGSIPEFTYLPSLIEMDLSHNELDGKAPLFENLYKKSSINLSYNNLSFDGMESHVGADKSYFVNFSNQDSLGIEKEGNLLTVNAGGSDQNVYYSWYKDNQLIAANIRGCNSMFTTSSGTYRCVAKNTLLGSFTLNSHSFKTEYQPEELVMKGVENESTKWTTLSNNVPMNIAVNEPGAYILKLIDTKDNKTVAFEQNHTVTTRKIIIFTMSKVPKGKYILRITGGKNFQHGFNVVVK